MTNSKYIGYCVLYNALKSIEKTAPDFVASKANEIISYATTDKVSQNAIEAVKMGNLNKTQFNTLKKISNNYEYVENVRSLLLKK